MKRALVIAPHPDDETFGCGGSLFRHKENGYDLYWLIITSINSNDGWSPKIVKSRNSEINLVAESYAFNDVVNLNYPATKIISSHIPKLVNDIGDVIDKIKPKIIYSPHIGDVHTDHQYISKAIESIIKWFRHPSIRQLMVYETLSETNFSFVNNHNFSPNYFIDISKYIDDKIRTVKIYDSEIGNHPFPRSEKAIRALATLRGSQSGYNAAEAFQLVYGRK
jgi:N-acetylglucosamine malate deacetylase 1